MSSIPNDFNSPASISNLPNESILHIIRLLDKNTVRQIKLVNSRFRELGATVLYERIYLNRRCVDNFPNSIIHYVKDIQIADGLSQFEIAWFLRDRSRALKGVSLTLKPELLIFKELVTCSNLERVKLKIFGSRSEWESIFQQVFQQEDQQCWKKVREVDLVFYNDMGFDMFSPLVPNVEKVDTIGGNLKFEVFPKTIKRFSNSIIAGTQFDSRIFGTMTEHLPLLEDVCLKMFISGFQLPPGPYYTLSSLVLNCSGNAARYGGVYRHGGVYHLCERFLAFPNLRRLEVDCTASSLKFGPDTFGRVVGLHLRDLSLAIFCGPSVRNILTSFPNLTKAYIKYNDFPFEQHGDVNSVTPGQFSKLQKLTVVGRLLHHEEERTWLRRSILESCYSTNRRDFKLTYAPFVMGTTDRDTGRFLSSISEVAKGITAAVHNNFKPEWLDLLSDNLKEFDLHFVGSNETRNEMRRSPSWVAAVENLQRRGVQIGGDLSNVHR